MKVYVLTWMGDAPTPMAFDTYDKAMAAAKQIMANMEKEGKECETMVFPTDEDDDDYPILKWECKMYTETEDGNIEWADGIVIYETELE